MDKKIFKKFIKRLDLLSYIKYFVGMKRKKMGRPRLPKNKARSAKISLRLTPALRKAVEQRAKQENKSMCDYIISKLQSIIERGD